MLSRVSDNTQLPSSPREPHLSSRKNGQSAFTAYKLDDSPIIIEIEEIIEVLTPDIALAEFIKHLDAPPIKISLKNDTYGMLYMR